VANRTQKRREVPNRIWLTPAEFERWLPSQGVQISHQNLYKTYLGRNARYPIPRSSSGKIHRGKALELINLARGRAHVETGSAEDAARLRLEAEARWKAARAAIAEIKLEELRGRKVDVDLVRRVWTRTIETLKSDLLNLARSLPDLIAGRRRAEQAAIIERAFRELLLKMSREYERGAKR